MPIKKEQKDSCNITLVYLLSTGIVTLLSNVNEYDLLNYMKLDYKKIIFKSELWRLITTFLYIGKPSLNLIFNYFIYYKRMKSTEKKFYKNKKLSEFIMLLFYLMLFTHLANFFGFLFFKIKPNSFLSHQLMFSIILINSKRNPEKYFRLYHFIRIPNKFMPYFLFVIRTKKNGKVLKNLISFIPGLAYYYIKDLLPKYNNKDILVTPKFVENFCKKFFYEKYYIKRRKNKINEINKKDNNNDNNNKSKENISNGNNINEKIKNE